MAKALRLEPAFCHRLQRKAGCYGCTNGERPEVRAEKRAGDKSCRMLQAVGEAFQVTGAFSSRRGFHVSKDDSGCRGEGRSQDPRGVQLGGCCSCLERW